MKAAFWLLKAALAVILAAVIIGIIVQVISVAWGWIALAKEWIFWITAGMGISTIVWAALSIKIVGPEEMAVLALLGKPVGFRDSGLRFVPVLPGTRLVRFPKKLFNLDYPARKVVSSEGLFQGREYGAQALSVDLVAYVRFPRGDKLVDILRSQVPIKDEALKDWTEEAVVGALRVAFGSMTWKEATEGIEGLVDGANVVFKAADGALLMAGFKEDDIKLSVKEIRIPSDLEKSLTEVDRQRLEAEAAQFEARQRAIETVGAVVEMLAQSRGRTATEIQQQVNADPTLQAEFMDLARDLITRRMAIDGKSFADIRVPQGTTLEGLITLFQGLFSRVGPRGGSAGGKGDVKQGEGDMEVLLPGGRKVFMSKEERARRGFSY